MTRGDARSGLKNWLRPLYAQGLSGAFGALHGVCRGGGERFEGVVRVEGLARKSWTVFSIRATTVAWTKETTKPGNFGGNSAKTEFDRRTKREKVTPLCQFRPRQGAGIHANRAPAIYSLRVSTFRKLSQGKGVPAALFRPAFLVKHQRCFSVWNPPCIELSR